MSILIKKIIFQQDFSDYYQHFVYNVKDNIPFTYTAGELLDLAPFNTSLDPNLSGKVPSPLFNQSGLMRQVLSIGKYGIFFLEIRPGYKLAQLSVEPDEIVIDIYYGKNDTLIYSFYNPLDRKTIIIRASLEKDIDNIYQKIKSDPKNLEWRQYFVKRDLIKFDKTHKPEKVYPELMTADQVADYLQCKKKTIQNWTSENKIPYEGRKGSRRYRKHKIDQWYNSGQGKKREIHR